MCIRDSCTTIQRYVIYSGQQHWPKSPFLNNFFEIMKKRHNSAPWAPDEASPYLNESSRCAESESEEHFVRKAHFSPHFSVKKCDFPIRKKIAKLDRNQASAQYLGSAWRQDQDAGLKILEFWPRKTNQTYENGLLRQFCRPLYQKHAFHWNRFSSFTSRN